MLVTFICVSYDGNIDKCFRLPDWSWRLNCLSGHNGHHRLEVKLRDPEKSKHLLYECCICKAHKAVGAIYNASQ